MPGSSFKRILPLAAIMAAPIVHGAQLNGVDDFNDNLRDTAKWGDTDGGLFNGRLTEANGRIEYSVFQAPSFVDFALRTWRLNVGSYTNDWLAEVEINLPDIALFTDGQGMHLTLGLLVSGNSGHNVGLNIVHVREGGMNRRRFEGVIQRSGFGIPGADVAVERTATLVRVRLRFVAQEKVLHLERETEGAPGTWDSITSFDLDSPEIDWQLTEESTFDLSLGGTSFSYRVTAAEEAWFDNFVAASRPVILGQPVSVAVSACEAAMFEVEAEAGPLVTYQWRRDGNVVFGATNPVLMVSELEENRDGSYDVVVTNPAGSVTSEVAILTTSVVGFTDLNIIRDQAGVRVRWPVAADCQLNPFTLQRITTLGSGGWDDIDPPYAEVDDHFEVAVPTAGASAFFRLIYR
jgi:hypothetical protein